VVEDRQNPSDSDGDSKPTIDKQYVTHLHGELLRRYPGWTIADIIKKLKIGPNTYSNLFNNQEATDKTLNLIANHCEAASYETFQRNKAYIELIQSRLTEDGGVWASYHISRTRKMYESFWHFSKKEDGGFMIDPIQAKRNGLDYNLEGFAAIDHNLTLNMRLRSNDNHIFYHQTVFSHESTDEEFCRTFKFLVFDVTYIHAKENYTTLELLVKIKPDEIAKASRVEGQTIPMKADLSENGSGLPQNRKYLAFNYLNRHISKARRILDNHAINDPKKYGSILDYTHDIFISCPIRSCPNQEVFDKLRKIVTEIKGILINPYKFHPDNIHARILNYESLDTLSPDHQHDYHEIKRTISATHYICLIPEELGSNSSAVYDEINFRVNNKLPALIFLENRRKLPFLIRGYADANSSPNNVQFKDVDIHKVPNYLKYSSEYTFQFSI